VDQEESNSISRWRRRSRRAESKETSQNDEEQQRQEIAENLAALHEVQIREVMTPRVDVEMLMTPVTAKDVAREVRASGHSCYPVVLDDLDDVVGLLYVKDLFRAGREDFLETESGLSTLDISRRVRSPLLLPESMDVLEALSELRAKRRSVALVVDEYGGVAGILSLKDLLEPLVGDLIDEFEDTDEHEVSRIDATRWLVDGQITLDDLADKLGLNLPDGEYVTLAGFLLESFDRIPDEGDELSYQDWSFRIQTMEKRRIEEVLVGRLDHVHEDSTQTPAAEA
jgi:putative hemolysin